MLAFQEIILTSALLGLLAGFLAGLFGIGGGMIIVPVLVLLFSSHGFPEHLVPIMAIATSLATIVLTSIASVWAHYRLGAVIWPKVLRLMPGVMLGAVLGAVIADHIASEWLRYIFIAYLSYAGFHMAVQTQPKHGRSPSSCFLDGFVSVIIGLTSALVGIGGGTLTVPYLVFFQIPMRNAVAVASACGLPIALTASISYALLGRNATQLPEWSWGYIYLPSFFGIFLSSVITAPIGARLANRLPAQKLKRYFSLFIFILAAKLMWG
jgi:uncharacterized membrane protein YfcA